MSVVFGLEQVSQNARMVLFALDSSVLSPESDGGAAAIACSEEFVRRNCLENKAVEILAMDMATDTQGTFEEKSLIKVVCLQGLTKHSVKH